MKIHSSSLHALPSGLPANKPKQSPQQSQINDSAANKSPLTPSSSQEFASVAERENQQQISPVTDTGKIQSPLNAKALKAVNAYTETFNDFIHEQVSAKITGIDFYV